MSDAEEIHRVKKRLHIRGSSIILSSLFFLSQHPTVFSQQADTTSPLGRLHVQLQSIIEQAYGPYFSVIQIQPFDSIIGRQSQDQCGFTAEITDPFGTLHGNILFSVHGWYSADDSNFIGIYNDGRVVWQSGWMTGGFAGIAGVADINRDGSVDLLTRWKQCKLSATPNDDGTYDRTCTSYLWIFSWDGSQARTLNAVDKSGKSVITGDCIRLQTAGKKRVQEIHTMHISDAAEAVEDAIYRWNGSTYSRQHK